MMELLFVLYFVLGTGFSVLVAAALLTYLRRSWQIMRSEEEGSPQQRILEGLDELRIQLDLLGARMERVERALEAPHSRAELPGPEGEEPDEESAVRQEAS